MQKLQGLKADATVLDRWRDVDSPEDLEELLARLSSAPEGVAVHTRAWLGRR